MKSLALVVSLLGISQMALSAQMISDTNIFNDGATQATVAMNTTYPGFNPNTTTDLNTNGSVFGDYLRPGGSFTTINDQLMSITGFSDPTGIGSLRFFDINNYESGRVADQVTIYYSFSAATGNSLNLADYTAANGGLAYALPISSTTSNNAYTGGVDPTNGYAYDTLTGLSIPIGTKSILLDFGPERNHNGGPTTDGSDPNDYNIGAGFAEIQAFGDAVVDAPEPSTWAMMVAGLAFLGFVVRRKRATVTI